VPATQNGVFAYTWQPSTAGNYSIRAYWPGDQTHSSASRVVAVRVVGSSVPTFGVSDVLTPLFQAGLAGIRQVPYLSSLITFAASMLTLGYVLTSFLLPGASPMFGYFIGSIFVGFIYVFPLSAAVVLIRASKTGRRPSLLWLTPLLTIWLSSLALVIISPTLVTPQPLVVASQILLVFSNVFVIPLLAAFRLARLVV